MPQLNPSPWFMTLIATWLMVCLLQPLLMQNLPPARPAHCTKSPLHTPWDWWQ